VTSTPSRSGTAELQGEVTSLRKRAPSFEQLGGEAAARLQEAGRKAQKVLELEPIRCLSSAMSC
jgi:hypothetical protein